MAGRASSCAAAAASAATYNSVRLQVETSAASGAVPWRRSRRAFSTGLS